MIDPQRVAEHYLPDLAILCDDHHARFWGAVDVALTFPDLPIARRQTPTDLYARFLNFAGEGLAALPPERVQQFLYDENDARHGPLFAGDTVSMGEHTFTVGSDSAGERVRLLDGERIGFRADRMRMRREPDLREPVLPEKWCTDHNLLRTALLEWTDDGTDDLEITVDGTIQMLAARGLWPTDECRMANGSAKDFAGKLMRRKRAMLLGVQSDA